MLQDQSSADYKRVSTPERRPSEAESELNAGLTDKPDDI